MEHCRLSYLNYIIYKWILECPVKFKIIIVQNVLGRETANFHSLLRKTLFRRFCSCITKVHIWKWAMIITKVTYPSKYIIVQGLSINKCDKHSKLLRYYGGVLRIQVRMRVPGDLFRYLLCSSPWGRLSSATKLKYLLGKMHLTFKHIINVYQM